jgi:integrase
VKKRESQPFVSAEEFQKILRAMTRPRDRIILKILYLCAVRRGEFLVLKWKDLQIQAGMHVFLIRRLFMSRTHQVIEWNPTIKAHGKAAVSPKLAEAVEGWRRFGDTNGGDPESYIFPTKTGSCLIPTNWIEDVLQPACDKAEAPRFTPHAFRHGHATVQHFDGVQDKSIQGQLRHSKAEVTRDVYMQQTDPETYNAVLKLESLVSGNGTSTNNERGVGH